MEGFEEGCIITRTANYASPNQVLVPSRFPWHVKVQDYVQVYTWSKLTIDFEYANLD